MKSSVTIFLALLAPSSQAYVWPSLHDHIDDLLYLQSGYIKAGTLSDQVATCDFGGHQPGIQKAAEWVRTAFHDTVTHDASTKTGGLDASIQYELDRPENLGAALNNTLSDISTSFDIRTSAADLIALSLVMAVARCGDMRVPLRLGRKDATKAGIKGVPEAHTDLDTTRKRFATASLSEVDMITLIACGHSIGGVHSVDHPEIVSGPVSPENKASFDTTLGALDNMVVVEYLNNSTANPLVRNANDTLNSDKRIFASDDNKTMKKLADATYFKSQCEDVFGRMLDLVPGDVTLTEPLEPADIRPYIDTYRLNANGGVEFSGRIRVRITPGTGRDPDSLTASIIPMTRNGTVIQDVNATRATAFLGQSMGYLDELFQWFDFSHTIDASEAFDSFRIRINNETYDNAGTGGYPVNSDVFLQEKQTCLVYDTTTNQGNLTVTVAISKALLESNPTPQIHLVEKEHVQGYSIPRLEHTIVPMQYANKETAEYVYYTAAAVTNGDSLSITFDVEVGSSKLEYIRIGGLESCEPLS
ncbi:uncharacterized protein yc1106_03736 [Curvularia clavata]|uniref:Peroxidase n=1 Tax=Curvularia clavata TaxID=95742 RepID=A0A9Q9DRB0_CURCL|nr:uncharacterized protein yc1106_03736 [Curvularia clavata]